MTSSSSTSRQNATHGAPIVEVRTKECLGELKNMSLEEFANVIILIGRTGVGKSALLEYLTNAHGHSENSPNPVTIKFQLERFELLGKRYYIMDTPGFDTDVERSSFLEIVRGIEAVRPHAKIVGVLLVTRINDNRAEALDNKLVTFVEKLCGAEYATQITAVTNFWNVSEPEEKQEFETRLEERLQRWRSVLGPNLKQYQHGRKYDSRGEDVGECLKWRGDSGDIRSYAKAMIHRHYGDNTTKDPRIVQELSENIVPGRTAAGEFLGVATASEFPPSAAEPSADQQNTTAQQPGATEPEAENVPRPPPSSSHGSATNDSRSETSFWQSAPGQFVLNIGTNIGTHFANNFLGSVLTPRPVGVSAGSPMRRFPSHLDPLSSHDHFIARGMPGDLGFRTQWARQRGINLPPGSSEFGDALRGAINRESPLN